MIGPEQWIHGGLLALHNIALVGCAAAPFYNRNLVRQRAQFGPRLHFELDKVVEDTLQANAPWCMAFMTTLVLTGIGMPLTYYGFHGAFHHLETISYLAMGLKLACITGMVFIMGTIFFRLNPRLRVLMAGFSAGQAPDPALEKEFFQKRARRKSLCETCLKFAIGVLVFSAFIGFRVEAASNSQIKNQNYGQTTPAPRSRIMKLAITISVTEPETVFNALRLANFARAQGDDVSCFLIGPGVELDHLTHPKFDVRGQAEAFLKAGGKILACGTCLKIRQSEGSQICPISSMKDLYELVRDSDKVVSF
jgi:uncharacterized protein involved in oxidation of intracellular sulfur